MHGPAAHTPERRDRAVPRIVSCVCVPSLRERYRARPPRRGERAARGTGERYLQPRREITPARDRAPGSASGAGAPSEARRTRDGRRPTRRARANSEPNVEQECSFCVIQLFHVSQIAPRASAPAVRSFIGSSRTRHRRSRVRPSGDRSFASSTSVSSPVPRCPLTSLSICVNIPCPPRPRLPAARRQLLLHLHSHTRLSRSAPSPHHTKRARATRCGTHSAMNFATSA